MSPRRLILAALLLAFASFASADALDADYVIPASGSGPGLLGSVWQSEVSLYNASTRTMDLTLSFHDGSGKVTQFATSLPSRSTTSIADIVNARFGQPAAVGAIVIDVADEALVDKLIVTSRTFNLSDSGEFGQDIPAVSASDTLTKGYSGIIIGPSDASNVRLNFGLFALADSTIDWKLLRSDGTIASELTVTYTGGSHVQYTRGVESFFGSTAADNDAIQADVIAGEIVLYGSAVNNATGDPSFVPPGRFREPAAIEFLGLDLDENGTVDVEARDGIVVRPIELVTSLFPNYFRVIAVEATGRPLTLTLVNPSNDVVLIDADTIQWLPGVDVKGTSGSLTVRATDGFRTADLIIPVIFK
ncbi:MAG TPA: hypothetical protein VMT00_15950 [Thermoanaerobaculia bacterium]|nr:hypothetical protein [Thermoanaerobaculia bacterium]